ncbi:MAG: hypothetical protein IJH70_06860 [Oscillospiraceae bacterium]|nr:hypothetical protein [Oscillospiraceae bacterium]
MKASEDPRIVYADIIDHPHHQSQSRAHMSLYDRAAQFSAFDALAGYSDMIVEEARLTENEAVLDENAIDLLNQKLSLISDALANGSHPVITFLVFVPDQLKDGGKYTEITDSVKMIDAVGKKVVLEQKENRSGINKAIDIPKIVSIRGELVDFMDESS